MVNNPSLVVYEFAPAFVEGSLAKLADHSRNRWAVPKLVEKYFLGQGSAFSHLDLALSSKRDTSDVRRDCPEILDRVLELGFGFEDVQKRRLPFLLSLVS